MSEEFIKIKDGECKDTLQEQLIVVPSGLGRLGSDVYVKNPNDMKFFFLKYLEEAMSVPKLLTIFPEDCHFKLNITMHTGCLGWFTVKYDSSEIWLSFCELGESTYDCVYLNIENNTLSVNKLQDWNIVSEEYSVAEEFTKKAKSIIKKYTGFEYDKE